jgi:DNA-binding transcriptional MocR family regulator
MSVQAISWALSVKTGSPSAKAVLLAIANYADANGRCWPSQRRIADETEQSIDSVQRRLRDLEKGGFIARERRDRGDGGRASDWIILRMPSLAADCGTPTADCDTPPRTIAAPPTALLRGHNEPSSEPSVKKKESSLRSEAQVKSRRKPAIPLPIGWKPSDEAVASAIAESLPRGEISREAKRFSNHATQNDRRCVDWDAAFRNWCMKAVDQKRPTERPPRIPRV